MTEETAPLQLPEQVEDNSTVEFPHQLFMFPLPWGRGLHGPLTPEVVSALSLLGVRKLPLPSGRDGFTSEETAIQNGPKIILEEHWYLCGPLVDAGFSGEKKNRFGSLMTLI